MAHLRDSSIVAKLGCIPKGYDDVMSRLKFIASFVLLLISIAPIQHAQNQIHEEPNPPNSTAQQSKHYVVMVSLDGFRYDYPTLHGAPNLIAIGERGAATPNGMRPSFPSITFPNHITLVTGLLPEHHGIVENSFFDPATGKTYSMQKTSGDGSFYSGVPLWSLAEQQGMRSATLFWPGSEAEIAGKRPSYWKQFDDKFDDEKRIDQVIAWLQLPPAQRPHLITLYYSNTDHAGHEFGPESMEERKAVHHVDALMGELDRRLRALPLPIDLIVTADHGMVTLKQAPVVLDQLPGMAEALRGVNHNGVSIYPGSDEKAEAIYQVFLAHPDKRFHVYRRKSVPASYQYNENPREGDPVVIANGPYLISVSTPPVARHLPQGMHGFDPLTMPEMKAIFLAAGPDIRTGVKLDTFQNVDVYDFVAKLLGLTPAPNDGSLQPLQKALK